MHDEKAYQWAYHWVCAADRVTIPSLGQHATCSPLRLDWKWSIYDQVLSTKPNWLCIWNTILFLHSRPRYILFIRFRSLNSPLDRSALTSVSLNIALRRCFYESLRPRAQYAACSGPHLAWLRICSYWTPLTLGFSSVHYICNWTTIASFNLVDKIQYE